MMPLELAEKLEEATVEDGCGSALLKHSPLPKHRKTVPPTPNNAALVRSSPRSGGTRPPVHSVQKYHKTTQITLF